MTATKQDKKPAKTEGDQAAEEAKAKAEARAKEAAHQAAAKSAAVDAGKSKSGYVVAEGKSLTCVRGIVDGGKPITALDFVRHVDDAAAGEARLQELVRKKYIVAV